MKKATPNNMDIYQFEQMMAGGLMGNPLDPGVYAHSLVFIILQYLGDFMTWFTE